MQDICQGEKKSLLTLLQFLKYLYIRCIASICTYVPGNFADPNKWLIFFVVSCWNLHNFLDYVLQQELICILQKYIDIFSFKGMISCIFKSVTQLQWRRKYTKPDYNIQTLYNCISFMKNLYFVFPFPPISLIFHGFYLHVCVFTHQQRRQTVLLWMWTLILGRQDLGF